MINALLRRLSRRVLFCAFNILVAVIIFLVVVEPLMAHFADRGDNIAERRTQLLHFQAIARKADTLMRDNQKGADPLFPGSEDRIGSADLQANIKSLVAASDIQFLGVRGLESRSSQPDGKIAVSVELEGSIAGIKHFVSLIENQTPFLFVTSAVLRSSSETNGDILHGEMIIEGTMHDQK